MKTLIILITFITITYSQQNSKEIVGFWKPENLNDIIEIYEENGMFYGKVAIHIQEADSTLPDKSLQILSNFKFDGEDTWEDGTIHIIKKEKEIDGEITLKEDGNINVEGSIAFFSKSFTWIRLNTEKIKKIIESKKVKIRNN